jgi:protein-tyrosine phosphatase
MRVHTFAVILLLIASSRALSLRAADSAIAVATPAAATAQAVGEQVPSDDEVIKDLHSLGLVRGHTNIFRCGSPIRDLVTADSKAAALDEATSRMKRLSQLGIRTVISLENPGDPDDEKSGRIKQTVALEKQAATAAGLNYISHPVANSGKNSMQDMSDQEVMKLLDAIADDVFKQSDNGGVIFHCSAGHDRTGILTAYIRIKYQHWPVDQAIQEMRRYGHNWPKFSANGGQSSWHEDHLRAISKLLAQPPPNARDSRDPDSSSANN